MTLPSSKRRKLLRLIGVVGLVGLTAVTLFLAWAIWVFRLPPPQGGMAGLGARLIAARLAVSGRVPCIEAWADDVRRDEPRVLGGRRIQAEKWPSCVRKVGTTQAFFAEDGSVILHLGGIWELMVEPRAGTTAARPRWPVSAHSYVSFFER
jgi:hypothetical protein